MNVGNIVGISLGIKLTNGKFKPKFNMGGNYKYHYYVPIINCLFNRVHLWIIIF